MGVDCRHFVRINGDRAEAERQLRELHTELCMKLVKVFMLLSLLLSVLGLTAMSSYCNRLPRLASNRH